MASGLSLKLRLGVSEASASSGKDAQRRRSRDCDEAEDAARGVEDRRDTVTISATDHQEGRALAHHARAMQLYPDPYFERLVALLSAADVAVVSDPQTGPLHARVRELMVAGINVSLGQDDISDAYYAFGRNNMLEVAFLGAHLLQMMSEADMELSYDAVTVNPARAIGLGSHELAVGNVANLVALEGETVAGALRFHAAPRALISHGHLIDRDAMRAAAQIPWETPAT